MERSDQQISPQRLCDAAEAALMAASQVGEQTGGTWPYPADLMGGPLQPQCLCEYTLFEIEQASQFLVRLGMIESPRKGRRI